MKLKPVEFWGTSKEDLKTFPSDVIKQMGYQLHRVQRGLDPDNYGIIKEVGAGAKEIRIKDADGWYRTIYVGKFQDAIYVLHAFKKKTNTTSKKDIDLALARYKEIIRRQIK
jgi:phage-related protein